MSQKKKGALFAIASMGVGVAAMPVAAFLSTAMGLGLASLSVYFIYLAG